MLLLGVILAGPVTYYFSKVLVQTTHKNAIALMQRQEFFIAASKFRSAILYELIGFYPINQFWDKNDFPRLYQSIPKIKSAAAEFRFFVISKAEFDAAVDEYDKYCRETKENDIFILDFSSMKKPGDINPRDKFNDIVDHLISFANEK